MKNSVDMLHGRSDKPSQLNTSRKSGTNIFDVNQPIPVQFPELHTQTINVTGLSMDWVHWAVSVSIHLISL